MLVRKNNPLDLSTFEIHTLLHYWARLHSHGGSLLLETLKVVFAVYGHEEKARKSVPEEFTVAPQNHCRAMRLSTLADQAFPNPSVFNIS